MGTGEWEVIGIVWAEKQAEAGNWFVKEYEGIKVFSWVGLSRWVLKSIDRMCDSEVWIGYYKIFLKMFIVSGLNELFLDLFKGFVFFV